LTEESLGQIQPVFPIYTPMKVIAPQTKLCPFCAETIQARALKCRFCGEFLNTDKAKALQAESDPNSQPSESTEQTGSVLFEASPSLWAMTAAAVKGLIFLGIAAFLLAYPLEELSLFGLTDQQAITFGKYRLIAGLGLAALVVLILFVKVLKLKMTRYEVSADRIEHSRGILDRRVDNLDMFRVIDLKLYRSLLDCLLGIGTVKLITTDKTDPQFTFKKIRNSRRLYDIIKKASLDADKKTSVMVFCI